MRRVYLANERLILGLLMGCLLLVAWEGLSRGWWAELVRPLLGADADRWKIKPIFISSPSAVAVTAWRLFITTGEIWPHLRLSALELVAGLGLAIVTGVPAGLVAARYRLIGHAVEPFMTALNATPQVAFLPLMILWLGTGLGTRIFIIFLLTLLPIFIASNAAVRTLDARLLKVAASFGSSEWFLFRAVILPGSVPFVLTGLRLAIGRGMIGIVVGELYGSATGIGLMINRAGTTFQSDVVFVGVFTIVICGLGLSELVRRIEKRVEAWRPGVGGVDT